MATTISSSIIGPYILSSSSLSITGKGTITSTSSNDGIDGASGTIWAITNSGKVSSAGAWGINLAGAGSLSNSGVISGASGGFETHGAGTVTNKGTISGASAIYFGAGGSVTNQAGGSLLGSQDTVLINGGIGTIINNGSISSTIDDGVFLVGGGNVTNQASGSISGGETGVVLQAGTVTNQGTITGTGTSSAGVFIQVGGSLVNQSGVISGGYYGAFFASGVGAITNKATITGTSLKGVVLDGGGSLANQLNGFITGGQDGVLVEETAGTITNNGTIIGTTQAGIELGAGGSVNNQPSGLISGGLDGVFLDEGGSITNQEVGTIVGGEDGIQVSGLAGTITNGGMISGTTADGVYLHAGGSVTNQQNGTISGSAIGVFANGAGTITNNGLISGGRDSVQFGYGAVNSRLIIDAGGVFSGAADATEAASSTIELAKGNSTITGIGNSSFLGFNTLAVDSGGTWALSGIGNAIGTVLDSGTLDLNGQLKVTTQIDPTSTGVFGLGNGSTLEVAKAIGISSKMSFTTGSELVVDDYNSFGQNVGASNYAGPLLENFGGDGTVDLKNFSSANITSSFTVSSGILQLQLNNGTEKASLDFQNSGLYGGSFHFSSDGLSGVLITRS